MRPTKQLASISNVSPGANAVLGLPIGVAYEVVKFKMSGITPAQMLNLVLRINGRAVQTWKSGAELQAINAYKGYAADATGYLTWYFVRPELNMIGDQRFTKLGTADLQTVTIEFEVDAATTVPIIKASALISNNAPLGVLNKVLRFSKAAAVAGLNEIDNVPTGGARISAIHFKKADLKLKRTNARFTKRIKSKRVNIKKPMAKCQTAATFMLILF
jgi:hypothetical protein